MKKITILTIILVALIGQTGFGQMPEDFLTKVSYLEKKEVTYSLPTEGDINCLTLIELSEYHGYMQFYSMEEVIDLDGELLSEQVYLDEYNVRDDWMDGLDRVIVGKNLLEVYNKNEGLVYQKPRYDSGDAPIFLGLLEAQKYGVYHMDQVYYNEFLDLLTQTELEVSDNGIIITGTSEFYNIFYDHNLKIVSETEFDSFGNKTMENVTEFDYNEEQGFYYPFIETKIEWFLTKNGCCIKRTTVITRYNYERNFGNSFTNSDKKGFPETPLSETFENPQFEILSELDGLAFRVANTENESVEVHLIVYDMAGRIVIDQVSRTDERIFLPLGLRAGMYVVYVHNDKNKKPIVGKIIKNDSSYKF